MEITLLIVAVALGVFIPWPKLGLTSEFFARYYPDRGPGLFVQDPQRAMVTEFIYPVTFHEVPRLNYELLKSPKVNILIFGS